MRPRPRTIFAPWRRTGLLASCLAFGIVICVPVMAQGSGGFAADQTSQTVPASPGDPAAPAAPNQPPAPADPSQPPTTTDPNQPPTTTDPAPAPPAPDANASPAAPAAGTAPSADANNGPIRMARFTALSGDITWRAGTDGSWSAGAVNMPLRQGAQVWVADGGKAEIQFDDGTHLRLDANTLITLQTLYSDSKGEYTEITLNDGNASLTATNQYSFYQVNTPLCSVKASGPAKFRVSAGNGVQVGVREGNATVQGTADHARLHSGDYLDLTDANSEYNIVDLPKPDAWDTYNDQRDQTLATQASAPTAQHVAPDVRIAAGDLDSYGAWRNDPVYGWVWVPTAAADPNWRPYYAGHWVWVEPFGWTWVSTEPWGWAPYHYGSWTHASWGWAWVPGPRYQYWSPGTVAFYQDGRGTIAWVPLAPREVYYPSGFTVGFRGGDWSLYFSIGGAAVYYPGAGGICQPRPWSPAFVNRPVYVTNVVSVNHNAVVSTTFIATNARFGGAISTTVVGFGGPVGVYVPILAPAGGVPELIVHAQVIGAPIGLGRSLCGPAIVRPTLASFSPGRTFVNAPGISPAMLNRNIFRADPPPAVASRPVTTAMPGQHFTTPTSRPTGAFGRPTTTGSTTQSGLTSYLQNRGGTSTTPGTTTAPSSGTGSNVNLGTPTPARQGVGSQKPFGGGSDVTTSRSASPFSRSANDAAEDRRSLAQFGHLPVERTSRAASSSRSNSSSSKDSGGGKSGH